MIIKNAIISILLLYILIGVCECFDSWVSSDGDGHPGNTGDCAFRMDETGINRGVTVSN